MKKNNVEKVEKSGAAVQIVGAPELIVTRASDKGVSCVVRGARLTWVFVKDWREDKNDWRKATKSLTLLIPKKGVKTFQASLADALKQCLSLNKKITDNAERMAAYKVAIAVNENSSLLKDGDASTDSAGNARKELQGFLTWQIKKSAYRDDKNAPFADKFPLTLQDAAGRPVEAAFIDREFYSGVYADVAFVLATYDTNGKRGVTVYLNGLRKSKDAERFGGHDPFAGVAATYDGGFSDDDIPF